MRRFRLSVLGRLDLVIAAQIRAKVYSIVFRSLSCAVIAF